VVCAASSPIDAKPANILGPGLDYFTHDDVAGIAPDAVALRYSGTINFPLAENIEAFWQQNRGKFRRVLLELNSEGGELGHVQKLVAVLKDIRKTSRLITLVRPGAQCASGCIPVFVQGEIRKASGASVFMFHGACRAGTNMPSLSATALYIAMMEEAGVSTEFTCKLVAEGYVTHPGKFWVSGYELFHVYKANVITELTPSWVPESPELPPHEMKLVPR
jgi:hypothetical protein